MTPASRVAQRFAALREALPYKWHGNNAEFDMDGTTFEVTFAGKSVNSPKLGPITGFAISFYKKQDKDAPWQYRPTGEGNAFTIFATVGAIIVDFLIKRKPQHVWFVADEPSRVRLYNKLIQKLTVPGYEATVVDTGKYILRRTKSVFDP